MQSLLKAVDKAMARKATRREATGATEAVVSEPIPLESITPDIPARVAAVQSAAPTKLEPRISASHPVEVDTPPPPEELEKDLAAEAKEEPATASTTPEEVFDPQAIMAAALAERAARKTLSPPPPTSTIAPEAKKPAPPQSSSEKLPAAPPTDLERPKVDAFQMLLANSPKAAQVGAGPGGEEASSPSGDHGALKLKGPAAMLGARLKEATEPTPEPDQTEADTETTPEDTGALPEERSLRSWFSPQPTTDDASDPEEPITPPPE